MNYNETKLRAFFYKWRQYRDRCNTRESRMRKALCNLSNNRIRSYFLNWKNQAHVTAIYL